MVTHVRHTDICVEQMFCRLGCRLIQTNVKFCVIDRDTLARYNPGKTRELEQPSFTGKSLVLPVQVDCGLLLMEMVDKFSLVEKMFIDDIEHTYVFLF